MAGSTGKRVKGSSMGGEELRELEASLSDAGRVCKRLKGISLACFVALFIACALLLAQMIMSSVAEGLDAHELKSMLYVVLYGTTALWLISAAHRSFSDVVNGESPFTLKQVARFRSAAFLLFVLAFVDAFLSTGFVYEFAVEGIDIAALGNQGVDQNQIQINAMAVFFAVMLVGVSALFRYGVLLQRLTDETE